MSLPGSLVLGVAAATTVLAALATLVLFAFEEVRYRSLSNDSVFLELIHRGRDSPVNVPSNEDLEKRRILMMRPRDLLAVHVRRHRFWRQTIIIVYFRGGAPPVKFFPQNHIQLRDLVWALQDA